MRRGPSHRLHDRGDARRRPSRPAAERLDEEGRKFRRTMAATAVLLLVAALILVALTSSGCASSGIEASAVEGTLNRVLDRHDAYVTIDPHYPDEMDREDDLRDSRVLREVLNAALEAEGDER